jgi:hypothetical protein
MDNPNHGNHGNNAMSLSGRALGKVKQITVGTGAVMNANFLKESQYLPENVKKLSRLVLSLKLPKEQQVELGTIIEDIKVEVKSKNPRHNFLKWNFHLIEDQLQPIAGTSEVAHVLNYLYKNFTGYLAA